MAFKLLISGRPDLLAQAMQILPAAKINTINENGMTALMLACVNGDEAAVRVLVDAGADVNVETPANVGGSSTASTPARNSRSVLCQSPSPNKSLNASSGSLTVNNNNNHQTSPFVTISLAYPIYRLGEKHLRT